jgi:putative hydroxymethylpyrimidine transport system ATP-binding protein
MLSFEGVTFRYAGDETPMTENLCFHIAQGEFVSLIGASGCGKSTVFRLACGLLEPEAGVIRAGGRDIKTLRRWCGYMPQNDLLFPWRTVGENLRLPLEIGGGLTAAEMTARVADALETVGLGGCADKRPAELSGGMRQRAAFARTLLTGSDLLLLDEPFSALDFLTRVSMREWLYDQWKRSGKTILFITHDVEEALFLSGRVLAAEGSPLRALRSVDVPLGRERTMESLAAPEIQTLKNQLISSLRKQVEP